jgi:hypothetical protein
MRDGASDRRGIVSVDGEEYVVRWEYDELREERDRLAREVEQLRQKLAEAGKKRA